MRTRTIRDRPTRSEAGGGATAMVTGGGRGLGRAMVQELVARGAVRVHSTGRSPQPGSAHGIIPLVLDVNDAGAVAESAGKLDDVSIVVNNAGILINGRVLDAPIGDIRAELETNLFGILNASRAFAPVLAGLSTARPRWSTCCRPLPGRL